MAKRKAARPRSPMETTLRVISGKWKGLVLWELLSGKLRFRDLKLQIPKITQKMLTQTLRELERDQLVHRQVFAEVPPRVEYSLTDFGKSLKPLLTAMAQWGEHHDPRRTAKR